MSGLNDLDPVKLLDMVARAATKPVTYLLIVGNADHARALLTHAFGGLGWTVNRMLREARLGECTVRVIEVGRLERGVRGFQINGYLVDDDVALGPRLRLDVLRPMMLHNTQRSA